MAYMQVLKSSGAKLYSDRKLAERIKEAEKYPNIWKIIRDKKTGRVLNIQAKVSDPYSEMRRANL